MRSQFYLYPISDSCYRLLDRITIARLFFRNISVLSVMLHQIVCQTYFITVRNTIIQYHYLVSFRVNAETTEQLPESFRSFSDLSEELDRLNNCERNKSGAGDFDQFRVNLAIPRATRPPENTAISRNEFIQKCYPRENQPRWEHDTLNRREFLFSPSRINRR